MLLNTTNNPKFRRLLGVLDVDVPILVGYLELFWHFAYLQAPAGDVGKWSDDEIEAACYWTGRSGDLVAGLLTCGFVDPCTKTRLVIHDWEDHAPRWIQRRVKRESLAFAVAESGGHGRPAGSHDDPMGGQRAAMGTREEKRSHSTPREEKPSPPARAPRTASSSKKIPKPEKFEGSDLGRILTWAEGKNFREHVLKAGLDLFREWSPLKIPLRTPDQWVSSFMRITRESVADGNIPTAVSSQATGSIYGHRSSPAQIAKNELVKQARLKKGREANQIAAVDDDPTAVGELIDRSIASASNRRAGVK